MLQPSHNFDITAGIQSLFYTGGGIESTNTREAATFLVCRSALVKSPAASRAALAKHRAFIDPELAKALGIVGGYAKNEVMPFFLTLSLYQYFVVMMRSPGCEIG